MVARVQGGVNEGGQRIQASSYKMNSSGESYVQHGDYS